MISENLIRVLCENEAIFSGVVNTEKGLRTRIGKAQNFRITKDGKAVFTVFDVVRQDYRTVRCVS